MSTKNHLDNTTKFANIKCMKTRTRRARIFALGFAAMFMLSAVIVGVTLGVQNQRPTEAATLQYTRVLTMNFHSLSGRMTINIFATSSANFSVGSTRTSWSEFAPNGGQNMIGNSGLVYMHSGLVIDITPSAGFRIAASGNQGSSSGWSAMTGTNMFGMSIGTSYLGESVTQSHPAGHHTLNVTIESIPVTTVTTTATLRRTDTNATIPWSNTGAPNLNVTINALTWLGTPTPPANHSFDGWSPATRTVNRGNGTNHGILDFTPIFTPLAPTIHLARFYLNGGNIDGQIDFYDVPQIDGMRTPQPRNPQKDGYAFRGWFTEQHGGDPFNFLKPKTSNQTIHAQWEQITGNVVILHFAGGLSHNETVWYFNTSRPYTLRLPGADIMNQNPPTPGQVFLGWFDNMERVGVPVVMVDAGASGSQLLWARWG